MKTLSELFKHNDEMPIEDFRAIREGFIRPLREELVGRRLMPIRRFPAGTQVFAYDRIKAEEGPATVIGKLAEYPRDAYAIERVSVNVPKIGKAFLVSMEDWEAGSIGAEKADQLRRQIALKEDGLIFDGDADFGVGGLLDFAGNTVGATAAWDVGTTTPISIYDDVRAILKLLSTDKVQGPYSLVAHPNRVNDLGKVDINTPRSALELVRGIVSQVFTSYAVPAGTVMVMRTGADIAQLGVVEDINITRPRFDEDIDGWKGKVRARLIPIIYQYGSVANKSDAIGTITSAGS